MSARPGGSASQPAPVALTSQPALASQAYRAYVLAMLVLVYTFNFIDRQIVAILAVPIKTELRLSDSQLGLMGGLAFALLYTTLGIPIARLADRASRTWIMTGALALWSAMSAACGLAHSFVQLFLARVGVGIGEAGGVAPAYSLICDFFPQNQRGRALGVYSFGIPLGGAASSMMGYGMFFWAPSFLVRSFGLKVLQASLGFGAIVLIGGLVGIWLGGAAADRFGGRRKSAYALVPAIAFVATTPFYVAGVLSTTLWMAVVLLLVPTALGLAWLGPVLSAVQHTVPHHIRATASAIFLFINNLLGIGLGLPLIGGLSDAMHVRFGSESLRYAIVAGSGFYLIAAGFLGLASRRLQADWEA